MKCLNPIMMYDTGRLTASGKRLLTPKCNPRLPVERHAIPVPCGKCAVCREFRRREWCARLRLEQLQYPVGSFITLTYKDNPKILIKSDIQRFVKRWRNIPRDYGFPLPYSRYFFAGEYGTKRGRPHWHGIIFGTDFLADYAEPYLFAFKDCHPIYSSLLLNKLWPYGIATCDKVTFADISYVSKYVTKDNSVSLKSQGIGRSLFFDVTRRGRAVFYRSLPSADNLYANGLVVLPSRNGYSPVGIPKAFDRYLERTSPDLFRSVKSRRSDFVSKLPFSPQSSRDVLRYLSTQQSQERILDNET